MEIKVAGENAIIVYANSALSQAISPETTQKLTLLELLIKQQLPFAIIDTVLSYASLLIIFNIQFENHFSMRQKLNQLLPQLTDTPQKKSNTVHLPVYYDAPSTPDLAEIAQHHKLTKAQIIDLHQQTSYQVYAIGFAPGFAFLGEVPATIAMPRKATPRLKVPKGAVGIADRQTAVYPAQSPGGWNLIGLCPITMFNPDSSPSMPIKIGDFVKFNAIDKAEFIALGGEI